ncbi:hypothetical protein ACOMHN_026269 [Nucella lapillus]
MNEVVFPSTYSPRAFYTAALVGAAPASGRSMMVSHPVPPHKPICPPANKQYFGKKPCSVKCQHCGYNVITTVTRSNGTFAKMAGLLICMSGGILGCCLIPCCTKSCKDATHLCPKCDREVGRFTRMDNRRLRRQQRNNKVKDSTLSSF